MDRVFSGIILLLYTTVAFGGGPVLPEKWRAPTYDERCETAFDFCFGVLVSGDFDGNGLTDGAVVVISQDDREQGLLVFMYESVTETERWVTLDVTPYAGKVSMGIQLVPSGFHEVLCQSEAECSGSHKKEILLENDSFSYYRFASSSSIWVHGDGGFKRIWQTD